MLVVSQLESYSIISHQAILTGHCLLPLHLIISYLCGQLSIRTTQNICIPLIKIKVVLQCECAFLATFLLSVTSLKQPRPWLHGNKHFLHCPNPLLEESYRNLIFHMYLVLSSSQHKKWIILIVATTIKKTLVSLRMGENKTGRQRVLNIWGK